MSGADRTIAMSVREARMYVGRILLTCGLPSGAVHAVTETILASQAAGLGGFVALLRSHDELRMDGYARLRVTDVDAVTLDIDAGEAHAWLLVPTLLDLAVDVARRQGRAALRVRSIRAAQELRIMTALARRHGACVDVARVDGIDEGGSAGPQAIVTATNCPPPRHAAQWDPLLFGALQHGYPVSETLWRDLHALSNGALARDSVVSRRHAGPVILLDDGTVVGRQPSDDDYDPDMLRSVPASPASVPSTPVRTR